MNKRLAELLERVPNWPEAAQEEAVAGLEGIEARVNANAALTPEEQEAKLEALREMLRESIARGGDYSPDDIDAMIEERFGDARAGPVSASRSAARDRAGRLCCNRRLYSVCER